MLGHGATGMQHADPKQRLKTGKKGSGLEMSKAGNSIDRVRTAGGTQSCPRGPKSQNKRQVVQAKQCRFFAGEKEVRRIKMVEGQRAAARGGGPLCVSAGNCTHGHMKGGAPPTPLESDP